MESNDFSREMKTRSSYQVKKGRENEWIWSDWVKTVFGSCGIWSNQIKEEPLKELVIFEDEAVQEITRKSGIEAASEERSKLVKGSEDKRVIRDWKQGKDELYQLVGRLKEVWLELTARPEVIQERREQDVIFNFLVNEMCELVQYICDVCEKNKKSIQWKGVTNCKKGRLRKLSKVWFMRRKAWRKDSESGYLSDKMSLKMIKEAAQLVVRGECSYSAYMGESVEDSVVLREQEKEGGADDCITRKEWRVFMEHVQALAESKKHGVQSGDPKPIVIDSGASHHMISDRRLISEIKAATGSVMIANGAMIPIEGVGKLKLFEKDTTAFYMPRFTSNLLSVKKATIDLDCQVVFRPDEVEFQDLKTGRVIGRGDSKNQLYHLQMAKNSKPFDSVCLSSAVDRCDSMTWHARLGHPHARAIELIMPNMSFNHLDCEACILGKHCRTVFPTSETTYEHCFDLVHSDVWTAPCLSRDSQKYFVTFIDEKSKYTWLTLLPSKDRVLEAFMNFQAYVSC